MAFILQALQFCQLWLLAMFLVFIFVSFTLSFYAEVFMLLNKSYIPLSFSSFPRVAFFFIAEYFIYMLVLLAILFFIILAIASIDYIRDFYSFVKNDVKELSINVENMNSELDDCLYDLDDNVLRGDNVIKILPMEGKMFLSPSAKGCYFQGVKK